MYIYATAKIFPRENYPLYGIGNIHSVIASHSCFCSFFHQSSLYPIKIFANCFYLLVIIIVLSSFLDSELIKDLRESKQLLFHRLQNIPHFINSKLMYCISVLYCTYVYHGLLHLGTCIYFVFQLFLVWHDTFLKFFLRH